MTKKYGPASTKRLYTCHTDLQVIFKEAIKVMDISILCGHRDEAEQQKAVEGGFSKVNYPNSRHNTYPSMAVDAAPYNAELRSIDWEDKERFYYMAGSVKEIARQLKKEDKIMHELRWGGDWDRDTDVSDQTFIDLPDFELVGEYVNT